MNFFWATHTRDEIQEKVIAGWQTAILPLGAIEQHGPHLAVNYDSLIADRLAEDLAVKLTAFILPSIHYGMSAHHLGFSGTISLSEVTMLSILNEIAESVWRSGIRKLVLVNGHGGNYSLIGRFEVGHNLPNLRIIHDASEKFIFRTISDFSNKYDAGNLGLHAGQFETSLALHTHPEAVRIGGMKPGLLPAWGTWSPEEINRILVVGLVETAPTGVIGDPCLSTSEQGELFYKRLLEYYEELCK